MALGNPLGVRIVVHDEAVLGQLRSGRRQLNQAVKRGLYDAATEFAVPAVRALAPSRSGRLRESIEVRATTRGAYITSRLRGKAGRYVAVINYGGTVRPDISPRPRLSAIDPGHAPALALPGGVYVSQVQTPRVYRARLFFEHGRDAALPAIEEVLADRVVDELVGGVRALLA